MAEHEARRVGLFVTCLVDLIRPTVGFAAVKLMEDAGCIVEVPRQTCCGQPAFNSGDRATTREIAAQVIEAFEPFDYVVAPSGSCAGMLKVHYPELFRGDPNWQPRADAFAAKTYELVAFLVDVLRRQPGRGAARGDRHLSRFLLGPARARRARPAAPSAAHRRGPHASTEMRDADVCCGFGGTFCVKYPDISNAIVGKKAANIAATGADTAARRRSRLPDEHGRQAAARGQRDRGASRRRGAGRHDGDSRPRSASRPAAAIARGRRHDATSRPRRASRTTPRRRWPTPTCRTR